MKNLPAILLGLMVLTLCTRSLSNQIRLLEEVSCDVVDCIQCSSDDYCIECEDQDFAYAEDGVCICWDEWEKFNDLGQCQVCNQAGCASCSAFDEDQCVVCYQDGILSDGVCICPQNQYFNGDGLCDSCQVVGCARCVEGETNVCQQCIDQGFTEIVDGQCQCILDQEKPDYLGLCYYCYVVGCASCNYYQNQCIRCLDSNATLTNNNCFCPQDQAFNEEGFCIDCFSSNCFICDEIKGCLTCFPGFALDFGLCLCKDETQKINPDGFCSQCSILNCYSCQTNDPHICVECYSGLILSGGQCLCENGILAFNEFGFCSPCHVYGCLSCLSEFPNECSQCLPHLYLEDSICKCYGKNEKLNEKKQCSQCLALNCKSCKGDDSNYCIKCQNDESMIVDGVCTMKGQVDDSYPSSLDWRNKNATTPFRSVNINCPGYWVYPVVNLAESVLIQEGRYNYTAIDLSEEYFLSCIPFSTCTLFHNINSVFDKAVEGIPLDTEEQLVITNLPDDFCQNLDLIHITDGFIAQNNLSEEQIIELLQKGPVVSTFTYLNLNLNTFGSEELYCLVDEPLTNEIALIVGYTESSWIIRNYITPNNHGEHIHIERNGQSRCSIGSRVYRFSYESCDFTCERCQNNNITSCLQCKDPSAELNDGVCQCPGAQLFLKNGMCSPCHILGCSKCQSFNPHACAQCFQGLNITQGFLCICSDSTKQVNSEGFCEQCQAQGCEICKANSPSVCTKCFDKSTRIVDGKCKCEIGYVMNDKGECVLCPIHGCQNCQLTGNQSICNGCGEGKSLKNEICKCQNNMVPLYGLCVCGDQEYKDNYECFPCTDKNCIKCQFKESVEVCNDCLEGYFQFNSTFCQLCKGAGCLDCIDQRTCTQCIDQKSAIIQDGKCQCEEFWQKISPQGLCAICDVAGCASCQVNSQARCAVCYQDGILSDGVCVCPQNQYFNGDGLCDSCQVVGCARCVEGETDVCQQCIDQEDTQLIDGKCICKIDFQVPDYIGQCFDCNSIGCASCQYSPKNCYRCLDPTAQLNLFRQCVCTDPNSQITSDGYCRPCEINLCATCVFQFLQWVCFSCKENAIENKGKGNCQCKETYIEIDDECKCPIGYGEFNSRCQPCSIQNCSECLLEENKLERCSICTPPYIVVDRLCYCPFGDEDLCASCSPLCQECDDGTCVKCSQTLIDGNCVCPPKSRFFNNNCVDCQKNCSLCTTFNDEEYCQVCQNGLLTFEGECLECELLGCQSCLTPTECQSCLDKAADANSDGQCECGQPFKIDTDGYCGKCKVVGCLHCYAGKQLDCFQCVEGATLIGDECHCNFGLTMDSDGNCVDPSQLEGDGYFQSNSGAAIPCPHGCLQCDSSACYFCEMGFYLNQDTCQKCHHTCKLCKGSLSSDCQLCYVGSYLRDGQCVGCNNDLCLKCNDSGCTECIQSYFSASGACESCEQNCKVCQSGDKCTVCKYGHTLKDNDCVECLSQCAECSPSDISQCLSCTQGLYLTQIKTCVACPDYCRSCRSQRCDECYQGFVLSNGQCVFECFSPCIRCGYKLSQQQCFECLGGYTLEGITCRPDYSCNVKQNCQVCPSGSILQLGVCVNCTTNDENCFHCSANDASQCISCIQSYTLQEGQCVSCPDNCRTCISSRFCTSCGKGYYLFKDQSGVEAGMCHACQDNCKDCVDTADKCTACSQGYQMSGWKCISQSRVKFSFRILMSWVQFMFNPRRCKTDLQRIIGNNYSSKKITLDRILNGSIIIDGNLQASSDSEGSSILKSVQENIKQGSTFMGAQVSTSSFQPENIEIVDEEEENNDGKNDRGVNEENDGWKTSLIAGLVGGLGGLALIIGMICIWKHLMGQRSQQTQEDKQESRDKIDSAKEINSRP